MSERERSQERDCGQLTSDLLWSGQQTAEETVLYRSAMMPWTGSGMAQTRLDLTQIIHWASQYTHNVGPILIGSFSAFVEVPGNVKIQIAKSLC